MEILKQLTESYSNASQSILVVGPWLDAYFTRIIINSIKSKEIDVKFIVKLGDPDIDKKTLSALNLARENLKHFQARSLENLHSKIIMIDSHTFFLGSANWYWYSLHKSVEAVIKGSATDLPELELELDNYWKDGSIIPDGEISKYSDFEPVKSINWK